MSSLVPFRSSLNFFSICCYRKWDLLSLLLNLLITYWTSGTVISTGVQNRTNKLPAFVKPKIAVVVPYSK